MNFNDARDAQYWEPASYKGRRDWESVSISVVVS